MPQLDLWPPESNWVPPTSFPDLSEAAVLAVDIETCDPQLLKRGPGWCRGDGYVTGVSLATPDGWKAYYPIAHPGPNMDVDATKRWLNDQLGRTLQPKIGHNIAAYDVPWLEFIGVKVRGPVWDTKIAAALVDESRRSYSLDACSQDYLGDRKSERGLYEAARYFGVDAKSGMHKLPAMFVGPYAEQDAVLTLRLWEKFQKILHDEDIWEIFELESDLLPCWTEMRRRGVRVNALRAEELSQKWRKTEVEMQRELDKTVGAPVQVWANDSVARAFDRAGIEYPRTAQGAPSFRRGWLETHPSPLARQIVELRALNKARSTYIDNLVFDHVIGGRIHCEFHPLRSGDDDENGSMRGTVSGRISSSNPNLQQVPARGQLGAEIRSLFLPEEGEMWASLDYSQQEPRILTHWASVLGLAGSEEMVSRFKDDPTTDVYSAVAEAARIDRKSAKVIFLGLSYGMGVAKLSAQLGLDPDTAKSVVQQFHSGVPFVRELMDTVQSKVQQRGWVKTLLGRRCRFELWEPARRMTEWSAPLPYADALAKWGPPLRRAYAYKALNRIIQGSAADQTKAAMRELWRQGIVPVLQVHDELCLSVPSVGAAFTARQVMETAVELAVPSMVDVEVGPSWGQSAWV